MCFTPLAGCRMEHQLSPTRRSRGGPVASCSAATAYAHARRCSPRAQPQRCPPWPASRSCDERRSLAIRAAQSRERGGRGWASPQRQGRGGERCHETRWHGVGVRGGRALSRHDDDVSDVLLACQLPPEYKRLMRRALEHHRRAEVVEAAGDAGLGHLVA